MISAHAGILDVTPAVLGFVSDARLSGVAMPQLHVA
jgi:hypothetical protein